MVMKLSEELELRLEVSKLLTEDYLKSSKEHKLFKAREKNQKLQERRRRDAQERKREKEALALKSEIILN